MSTNSSNRGLRGYSGRMKEKLINLKKGATWMKVENWLQVSKLLVGVGLVIFLISTLAKQVDGELAAYYWMGIGVVVTYFMKQGILWLKMHHTYQLSFIHFTI